MRYINLRFIYLLTYLLYLEGTRPCVTMMKEEELGQLGRCAITTGRRQQLTSGKWKLSTHVVQRTKHDTTRCSRQTDRQTFVV